MLTPSASSVLREPDAQHPGMVSRGAYPGVSRLKLAQALGKHVSSVSNYLSGKTPMPIELAVRMAPLVGVGLEELCRELGEWRRKWKLSRKAKRKSRSASRA